MISLFFHSLDVFASLLILFVILVVRFSQEDD